MTAYPEGAHALDNKVCTPLHVACRRGSSLALVKHLVDTDEMSLRLTDENQETPLHKACRGGHHVAIVQYLVEKNMPSASARNAAGVLPVFILCQASGKSLDIQDMPEYVKTIWNLSCQHRSKYCPWAASIESSWYVFYNEENMGFLWNAFKLSDL